MAQRYTLTDGKGRKVTVEASIDQRVFETLVATLGRKARTSKSKSARLGPMVVRIVDDSAEVR